MNEIMIFTVVYAVIAQIFTSTINIARMISSLYTPHFIYDFIPVSISWLQAPRGTPIYSLYRDVPRNKVWVFDLDS